MKNEINMRNTTGNFEMLLVKKSLKSPVYQPEKEYTKKRKDI